MPCSEPRFDASKLGEAAQFANPRENRAVPNRVELTWGCWSLRLFTFDAKTGKELWKANLGGSIVNAPITYQIDGKQYVSVSCGHTLVTFALRN